MNMETGEIKNIPANEPPPKGMVEVSAYEARYLQEFPENIRPFELMWLRTYKKAGWDGIKRAQRKDAFRQGWNAAVYSGAKFYVMGHKEIKEAEEGTTSS